MGAYLGNTEIGQMYLGGTEIAQAYLGSTKVWEAGSPEPPIPLPYDSAVEYLGYDGNQCIDTGITPNETIECEIVFAPTSANAASCGIFSARNTQNNSSPPHSAYALSIWNNGNRIALNDKDYDSGWKSGYIAYDVIKTASIKSRALYVDDTLVVNSTSTDSISFDVTYGLLKSKFLNGFDNRRGSSGKIYSAKIWKDGTLVRSFIPVRVEQVGYMYDTISGQLFGNAGTGTFVLGNDKN